MDAFDADRLRIEINTAAYAVQTGHYDNAQDALERACDILDADMDGEAFSDSERPGDDLGAFADDSGGSLWWTCDEIAHFGD